MRTLSTGVALLVALATWVHAETSALLQSLPRSAQKSIEDTRAECKELGEDSQTSGDVGLETFTLDGKQAVLIDPVLLCNGCHAGFNCTNRGTRDVKVYVRRQNSWARVLSNGNITGDIFISTKPGAYKEIGQELNALVVNLYIGNRECPTREAASASEQSYEARSCVLRWNGTRFIYKPINRCDGPSRIESFLFFATCLWRLARVAMTTTSVDQAED